MLEGRAAPRKAVSAISPELWDRLEHNVDQSPLAETYRYISSVGNPSLTCIGLRKAFDKVYVWFLTPVMGSIKIGGNAVVMEVTSESGHATYLFRVMARSEFPTTSEDQFVKEADVVVRDLNEAIIATGFRREPIYLGDDQLNTPQYSKYLYATKNLESLRFLRERFFARIIHSTFEQWRCDFNDAILFNTTTTDGLARWSKSKIDFIEPEYSQSLKSDRIPPTPVVDSIGSEPQAQVLQSLNVAPVGSGSMPDRIFTLRTMEADDRGNLKLWLRDTELDHESAIMITSDDAGKLGAFPGSKIRITLQKV